MKHFNATVKYKKNNGTETAQKKTLAYIVI